VKHLVAQWRHSVLLATTAFGFLFNRLISRDYSMLGRVLHKFSKEEHWGLLVQDLKGLDAPPVLQPTASWDWRYDQL